MLSEWITVYNGAEASFIDGRLERGKKYTYRIQAWNAVGKSEWKEVKVDKMWRRLRCDVHDPNISLNRSSFYRDSEYNGVWTWIRRMWERMYTLFKFLVGVIVVIITYASTYLKFKLASLPSTASTIIDTKFPKFWKLIDSISKMFIGRGILPQGMLGIHDGEEDIPSDYTYDVSVNAIGLDGHNRQKRSHITSTVNLIGDKFSSSLDEDEVNSVSTRSNRGVRSERNASQKRRKFFKRSYSANNIGTSSSSIDTKIECVTRHQRSSSCSDKFSAMDTINQKKVHWFAFQSLMMCLIWH